MVSRVKWEIDVDTKSPKEAAEEARKIQLDPESIATVFDVKGDDGVTRRVDLWNDTIKILTQED